MFGYLLVTVVAVCGSAQASELASAENADAVCMLQKLQLEAAANAYDFDRLGNLSAYDRDYVYDSPEGDAIPPVVITLSPSARYRLVVGMIMSIMIALVGLFACLFTSGDGNQKPMAFRLLTHGIAALCAWLVFKAIKDVIGQIFFKVTAHSSHLVGFDFALLFIIFVAVSMWLFQYPDSSIVYEIAGTIGMYVCGFAWTDTYQMISRARLDAITLSILVLALFAILLLSLVSSTRTSALKEGQAVTSEERFASMAIGYFISHMMELGISTLHISSSHKSALLNFVILCLVAGSLLIATFTDNGKVSEETVRLSLFARKICLMSAAWCLLDAITWQLSSDMVGKHLGLSPSSKEAAFFAALVVSLVILLLFAAVCAYTLFFCAKYWDEYRIKNVTIIVNTMGFAVGSAWANYLIQVMIASSIHSKTIAPAICTAMMCSCLCAVLIPVWHFHIRPYEDLHSFMAEK